MGSDDVEAQKAGNDAASKKPLYQRMVESNRVPTPLLRAGCRALLRQRIRDTPKDVEQRGEQVRRFVAELKTMPIAVNTAEANEQHYEVDTRFYDLCLGPRKKYSSCYWGPETKTLAEAENLMFELICERAGMKDGMEVMDLGCGWGSLALYLLETYPRCKVVAVSNSATQKEYIEGVARQNGWIQRLEVCTSDINVFDTERRVELIMSNEMFEHMKNYQKLMGRCASWLRPGGKMFIHIFTHRDYPYHFETGVDYDWMARKFFTGGTMPSDDLLLYFNDHFTIADHWKVNGVHYSKTLEAWLNLMDKNIVEVRKVFAECYGAENVTEWVANWRLFFIACSELFRFDGGNEWIVSHYLFQRRDQ